MKNRKNYLQVTTLILALTLVLSGCAGTAAPSTTAAPVVEPSTTVEPTAAPETEASVIGPWGLSTAKNDMASLYTVFGSSLRDSGAAMEIKSSGELSYYVGATGASGTYKRDGDVLTASLKDYNEGNEQTLTLTLVEDAGQSYLTAEIYDTTLWWTQNESELAAKPSTSGERDVSAYADVIEKYRSALSEKYDDLKLSEAGLTYMLMFTYNGDPLENVGYCYTDIGGDGVPELLIAAIKGEAFYTEMVFDAYTLADGKPVQLFCGGERDRYYTLSDGTLYNEGSNSAADSVCRQLTVSDGALSEMMVLLYNGAAEAGSGWTVSNFSSEYREIPADDATSMMDAWQADICQLVYIPFSA